MRKSVAGMLVAVATLAAATAGSAQVCIGNPNGAVGLFFGGRAATQDGDQRFGVEAGLQVPGGLGLSGGVDVHTGDGEDVNEYFVRGAFDAASVGFIIGPTVSACPTLEVRHASLEGSGSLTSIPVGVGVGARLSTLIGPSIHAYAVPQVVFSRFSADDDSGLEDANETDFGVRGGAILGFGTMYLGGEVEHVFRDGSDMAFGIRAGLRL